MLPSVFLVLTSRDCSVLLDRPMSEPQPGDQGCFRYHMMDDHPRLRLSYLGFPASSSLCRSKTVPLPCSASFNDVVLGKVAPVLSLLLQS